jgi:hypothetical protein
MMSAEELEAAKKDRKAARKEGGEFKKRGTLGQQAGLEGLEAQRGFRAQQGEQEKGPGN